MVLFCLAWKSVKFSCSKKSFAENKDGCQGGMKLMDFLNGKIKTLYFKYLAAAFGSALITSIYSIVDMAMVG